MNDGLTFGKWLKRRRQGLGYTQRELALRIGYAEVTLRKVEADERRPSHQMVEALTEHLEIAPQDRELVRRFARDEPGWADVRLPTQSAGVDDLMRAPPLLSTQLPGFVSEETQTRATARSIVVAREQKLNLLERAVEAALAGQGQVIFVTGEAGSGKTTLVGELMHRAQERHPELIVAAGACHAHTGVGDPYLPFRELLAMLTGDVEARWASGAISRDHALRLWRLLPYAVDTLVAYGPALLGALVPRRALAARAAMHTPEDSPWRDRLQALLVSNRNQNLDQRHLFEGCTTVLQRLAGQQPLLLMLDDLHWADISSIGLLFHLGRTIGQSRILIVGTYRPEEMLLEREDGPHPLANVVSELKRYHGHNQMSLDQVDTAEGRHFVDAWLDVEPNRLDETFRQALFRQGHGHPLFTVELLRDLQDRGDLLQDEDGRWRLAQNLEWGMLPARVEGVIEKRIGRLRPELQKVLAVASVEGETFTAEVVAQVMGVQEQEIVRWLSNDLQKRHRLVQVQGMQRLHKQRISLYRFSHHLFQTYLYQKLDDVERSYLHEAVGNSLEDLYRDREDVAEITGRLAWHFQEAGMVEKAIDYRLRAGQQAVHLSANKEAITHLSQGLALLAGLPDTPERTRRELALQIALGIPVTATQGYGTPVVERVYARAQVLGLQTGDLPQIFQAHYGLWRFAAISGNIETARDLGNELMELAQQAQNADFLVEAHRAVGVTHFHLGELPAALTILEQGVALYRSEQHRTHAFLYGHDPAVTCFSYLFHALWLLGYPAQALARLHDLLDLADTLLHSFRLTYRHIWGAAMGYQLQRDIERTRVWAESGLALANKYGFPQWQAHGSVLYGWAIAEQGKVTEGIECIQQGLAIWHRTKAKSMVPYYLCLLAEVYAKAGEGKAGFAAVATGLDCIAQIHESFWEAELYRIRGELLCLDDDDDAAEEAFQQAIAVARQQEAKSLELRSTLRLSRLCQRQGRRAEARQMLAAIYTWFTEGFATRDLQEARQMLTDLEENQGSSLATG
jgi:predicted ATPase/transcriptional regulator with XRE-family HTH domain